MIRNTDPECNIVAYTKAQRNSLLKVWEESVLATHDFLKQKDFEIIRELVHGLDFLEFDVYCVFQEDELAGFIGLSEQKIEMLFISPKFLGKGLGKLLIDYVVTKHHVSQVDVNEQNSRVLNFYRKYGFEVYKRMETDELGIDYPILKMKIKS